MNQYVLEPLDHTDLEGSAFDLAVPEPYKAPLVRSMPGRIKKAVRLAVGGYPANFVTREQWGARPPRSTSKNITPQHGGVAWHYEGPKTGTYGHDKCAGRVRQIQAFHMGSQRGWVDIAYSALVCPHGFIFEGRGLFRRTAANGTNSGNQTHYAICAMIGQGDDIPQVMIDAFKRGSQWMRTSGRAGRSIKPHRHFKPTGCPGDPLTAETRKWDGKDLTFTPAPYQPTPAPTPPSSSGMADNPAYRDQAFRAHPAHATPLAYKGDPTPVPDWVVKDIQGHLNYAYWDHRVRNVRLLKIDGDFGSNTDARLRDWQRRTGLKVDGMVGNNTWSRLHSVTSGRRVDNNGKAF